MIYTESMIIHMMGLDASSIEKGFRNAGYTGIKFITANFIGLNEHGQFVYKTYAYDDSGIEDKIETNVFATLDEDMKLLCDF